MVWRLTSQPSTLLHFAEPLQGTFVLSCSPTAGQSFCGCLQLTMEQHSKVLWPSTTMPLASYVLEKNNPLEKISSPTVKINLLLKMLYANGRYNSTNSTVRLVTRRHEIWCACWWMLKWNLGRFNKPANFDAQPVRRWSRVVFLRNRSLLQRCDHCRWPGNKWVSTWQNGRCPTRTPRSSSS